MEKLFLLIVPNVLISALSLCLKIGPFKETQIIIEIIELMSDLTHRALVPEPITAPTSDVNGDKYTLKYQQTFENQGFFFPPEQERAYFRPQFLPIV